jgi:hypothetical protein
MPSTYRGSDSEIGAAIDDIISTGSEPRGPWRRRAAIGTIAVVVLAALIIQHWPAGSRGAGRQHASGRLPVSASPPVPETVHSAKVVPAGRPDGITGPVAAWDPAQRLLIAGEQPSWFWPASGRVRRIGGLPDSPAGYSVTRALGGWLLQAAPPSGPMCPSCTTPPPVFFVADRDGAAIPLGVATSVAPAAEPRAAWLTTSVVSVYGGAPGATSGIAHKVTAGGTMAGPGLRLPAGYVIVAGTVRGLLLAPAVYSPGQHSDELWSPATGHVIRRFARVIGASPAGIAWAPACQVRCSVGVLDAATGQQRLIGLPAGSSPASAQFSQDGRLLALELSFGDGGDGGALAMRLEVAAVASGRLAAVPGTWTSSDALTGFGWPNSGDRLVAELGFVSKVQVASWRPGARRLAVAVVSPDRHPDDLVVG